MLQTRPTSSDGLAVMEDSEAQQRLASDPAAIETSTDVMARRQDERIAAQRSVARAHRGDAATGRLDGLHRRLVRSQTDRLLQPPPVRRRTRRPPLHLAL